MMNTLNNQPLPILGAGSWGTAVALHLARLGQTIHLWTPERDQIDLMLAHHVNQRYIPDQPFPDCLLPKAELKDAIRNARDILIAAPSGSFRQLLTELKPLITPDVRICSLTKGLDEKTGELLHELAQEILGPNQSFAVLSGPSFALEVAEGLPTAAVIASGDTNFITDLANRFNSPTFRVYSSQDVIGVEVGGAVKNVIAIGTGISDGMGFGSNARCALITRGLAEIIRLGTALGGKPETFTGLTGLGDLVLTCTDNKSRNRRVWE